jgi:hypothetical protein
VYVLHTCSSSLFLFGVSSSCILSVCFLILWRNTTQRIGTGEIAQRTLVENRIRSVCYAVDHLSRQNLTHQRPVLFVVIAWMSFFKCL